MINHFSMNTEHTNKNLFVQRCSSDFILFSFVPNEKDFSHLFSPNARVVSFSKVDRLGIQVSGGNAVGIFIISVKKDCAAYKAGLRRKDKILMVGIATFDFALKSLSQIFIKPV